MTSPMMNERPSSKLAGTLRPGSSHKKSLADGAYRIVFSDKK